MSLRPNVSQTDGAVSLVVEAEVPGLRALAVGSPSLERDLLHVLATEGGAGALLAGGKAAVATTKVQVDELTGRFQHRLVADVSAVRQLDVLLVGDDGQSTTVTVRGNELFTGATYTVAFGGGCYQVSADCGPPTSCHLAKTCCSKRPDFCVDCIRCEITCPPCDLPN